MARLERVRRIRRCRSARVARLIPAVIHYGIMSVRNLFGRRRDRATSRALPRLLLLAVTLTTGLLISSGGSARAVAGFRDVRAGSYYAEAVAWASSEGVTTGVSPGCFGGDQPATRAQFVVMLWRSVGSPSVGGSHPFVDIDRSWQEDALVWASRTGLVTGVSSDRFAPDEPISRGDLVAVLHRFAGEPVSSAFHGFDDIISWYHHAPVAWASHAGITTGTSARTFEPAVTATRAQIVTFLWRYHGEPSATVTTGGSGTCGESSSTAAPPSVDPIPSSFDTSSYLVPAWGDGRLPNKGSNTGSFRFFCGVSHLAFDDPIVAPGQAGGAHLHMFFGNTEADASSTYSSLRRSGDGTCSGGPVNRSAYWTPALLNGDGDVLTPDEILVYYKVGKSSPDIEELPAGLMMIGGYDMGTGTDHAQSWKCNATGASGVTIPTCPRGSEVQATVIFGVCWDGRLDSSNHRSHVIESNFDINAPCPGSHPHRLPQFELKLTYLSDGNTNQWYLSSDRHGGMNHPGGRTLHADWFGAWDPEILTTWTNECVNARRSCNGGEIGTGEQLSPSTDRLAPNTTYTAPHHH
jgi:hypothetical protein